MRKPVQSSHQEAHSPMEWRSLFEVILANTGVDFEVVTLGPNKSIRANEKDIAIISDRLEKAFRDVFSIIPLLQTQVYLS